MQNDEFGPAQVIEWVIGIGIYASYKARIGPQGFLDWMDERYKPGANKGSIGAARAKAKANAANSNSKRR